MKRCVVIGVYGPTLDSGFNEKRWQRWRPTVDLCRQAGLPIDRYELLVEHEYVAGAELVKKDILSVSPSTEVRLHPITVRDAWDFEEVFAALFDFVSAYRFNREREDYLVNITTGSHVFQICWFLLTEAHHIPGRLVQGSPPPRPKPETGRGRPPVAATVNGTHRIIDLDLARYDQLARRFKVARDASLAFLKSGIETRNAEFNRLIERLEFVSLRSSDPLLITGPTGAGKSWLASRVHELKRARGLVSGEFVAVNCATLRGDGAMSTLFGHVRGAFTGAASERKGLLKTADKGILFLDEVGELGLDEQAMLLKAIEEKVFFPVGSDRVAKSEFQLIAGTNRDLAQAVSKGSFREDLLARLDIWTFRLPSLAERREDLEPNLEYELTRQSDRLGRAITMNREARAHFLEFARSPQAAWSANFRDLSAAALRMATLAPDGRIDVATVREEEQRLRQSWSRGSTAVPTNRDQLREVLARSERATPYEEIDPFDLVQLAEVVRVCNASRSLSEAGRTLFAVSRAKRTSTNDADRLRKYLARFGLDWETLQQRLTQPT